jgi:glycerate dehydrogenase
MSTLTEDLAATLASRVSSGKSVRIVVLDGYILNPGDLSWDDLRQLGPTEIYDRTPDELVVERALEAEAILTSKVPLAEATLAKLTKLRYIGVVGTGYNTIDVVAAKKRGITVTNVPVYGTASVAQFAFALLLELCHHVGLHSDLVREGEWSKNADWSFWRTPMVLLAGKTMGVVGFGRIGRDVGRIAAAMQMRVLFHDAIVTGTEEFEAESVSLEHLLAVSDVVSLHCPLLPETKGIINARTLSIMKPSAFVINAARGPLVNEQDLADALNAGRLAGAGLDVLSTEPPPEENPLFRAKNCIITPHIAWATLEARSSLLRTAIENLAEFLKGRSQNIVS